MKKRGGGMEDRSRLSAIPTSIVGLLNNHEHPCKYFPNTVDLLNYKHVLYEDKTNIPLLY